MRCTIYKQQEAVLDTSYINQPRALPASLILFASVFSVFLFGTIAFVGLQAWQPQKTTSLVLPAQTRGVESVAFDPSLATILSPDLDRSAALIWLSEDRKTLSISHQNLKGQTNDLVLWIMKPQENWSRIGVLPRSEQAAAFNLTNVVPPESRVAVVLEGNAAEPGLILLSAYLR